MKTPRTILVAVDFSPGSRAALERAAALARSHSAVLHVLYVVNAATVAEIAELGNIPYSAEAEAIEEESARILREWVTQTIPADQCELDVRVGLPLHEILERARTVGADLLVAGVSGHGEVKQGAGSTASKLARKSRTNVLLVRAGHRNGFRWMVVCIDFSAGSQEAVRQACQLAAQEGARVDFLHVWQDPWLSLPPANAPLRMSVPSDEHDGFPVGMRATLEDFTSKPAQGIESACVLVKSVNYAGGIARHALESEADLIVIGGRGRTNLRYVLLGSTAETLLRDLPCSLLVVKPQEE